MLSKIFQVNWVFIDGIIIFLLFLLLISVKIFKSTHRWRLKFSNNALESYFLPKSFNRGLDQSILIKHGSLTRNSSIFKNFQKFPTILNVRTKFKKHLSHIITEGLSSYGFNIINLKIKVDFRVKNSKDIIEKEIHNLISSVIAHYIREEIIILPHYILLAYSRFLVPTKKIISDPMNKGLLYINPRLNKGEIRDNKDIFINLPQHPQMFYIFSRRYFFLLNNPHLKHFISELPKDLTSKAELITLEKSTRSFKYYETVLLGMIIDIIQNKILKS
jgi:hypothetical protein